MAPRRTPTVRLGDNLKCRNCPAEFVCEHPRQRYCSRMCAVADKERRAPRIQKRKEQNKRWRERHWREHRDKRRAWYQANKKTISEKQKIYRQTLPQEIVIERRRRHQQSHKDRENRRYHATRVWLPWLNAFRGSKARAKKHQIPFTLTKEWAENTWTGRCTITGIEFVLSTSKSPYLFSPSIDRIIPSAGYTPENSRFVLHAVNALKGAGTDEDMYKIAEALLFHRGLKLAPEQSIAPESR